jgi:hypothetical protein
VVVPKTGARLKSDELQGIIFTGFDFEFEKNISLNQNYIFVSTSKTMPYFKPEFRSVKRKRACKTGV